MASLKGKTLFITGGQAADAACFAMAADVGTRAA